MVARSAERTDNKASLTDKEAKGIPAASSVPGLVLAADSWVSQQGRPFLDIRSIAGTCDLGSETASAQGPGVWTLARILETVFVK